MASTQDLIDPIAHIVGTASETTSDPMSRQVEVVPSSHRIRMLSRPMQQVPTGHRIRLLGGPSLGPLGAFGVNAIEELTTALPLRRLSELLHLAQARGALQHGDVAPARQSLQDYQAISSAEASHPLASVAGRIAGSLPSFMVSGTGVKALGRVPLIQQALGRLASMGRLGRFAESGMPLAATFGGAQALQGQPETVPSAALQGLLAGGLGNLLLTPRAASPPVTPPVALKLTAPAERLALPPPSPAQLVQTGEVLPMGYDPFGAFRTGEPTFAVQSTVPPEFQVSPPDLGVPEAPAVAPTVRPTVISRRTFAPGQAVKVFGDPVTIVGPSQIPGAYEVKLSSGDVVPINTENIQTAAASSSQKLSKATLLKRGKN